MRIIVRCAMALVALAAATLSWQSLAQLGALAGYGNLAPLYPVVIDAGAAASCAAWLHTRGRQPLAMTWCLLAISVVLNSAEHWLVDTHTAPSWRLVVTVAAVPPVVLGLCVHLAVGLSAPQASTAGPESNAEPLNRGAGTDIDTKSAPVARPRKTLARSSARARGRQPTVIGPELVARAARMITEQPDVGRTRLARELGVTEHVARALMPAARSALEPSNGNGHLVHAPGAPPGEE